MVTQAAYDALKLEKEQLETTVASLQLQIHQLQRLIFGSKSERFTPTSTGGSLPTLFDVPPIAVEEVTSTQQVSYERKQKETRVNHPGRNVFPEKLRREEIILNPEGIDLTGAVRVGEDATEVLAYTPPEFYVKRTIRPRYHLPSEQRMVQAAAPERTFSRSSVDVSVGALIAVEKIVDHIPQCSASGSRPV